VGNLLLVTFTTSCTAIFAIGLRGKRDALGVVWRMLTI